MSGGGVVAAVTLGQSPRDDILDEMRSLVPHASWIQHGALDEVPEADLVRFVPRAGEFPLVTRLRAGRPIIVGERSIRPLVQHAIDRAASQADLVIVLCSTPLPLESRVPLLFPDRLLTAAVCSLASGGDIAVLTPDKEQIPLQESRWRKLGISARVICASPFGGTDFHALGRLLSQAGVSMIVLDSLAYSREMKAALASASNVAIVLVRALVASVAAEVSARRDGRDAERFDAPIDGATAISARAVASAPAMPPAPLRSTSSTGRIEAGAARVATDLVRSYALNRLGPGDRLPSVRRLARSLGVSPTTAAEWYRQLHRHGLVTMRDRSGTFLQSVGVDDTPHGRDAGVSRTLQRTLRQFNLLGMSAHDVARLLIACVNPASAARAGFACLLPLELFELTMAALERQLGFRPAMSCVDADGDPYRQLRRQVASGAPLRTLVCTHEEWPFAYQFARRFDLGLIVLQFDRETAALLHEPPAAGCARTIVTRDAVFAATIGRLIAAGRAGIDGRVAVTHLGDARGIDEAIGRGDELRVSAAALGRARIRWPRCANLHPWRIGLASPTVDAVLFRYLASTVKGI